MHAIVSTLIQIQFIFFSVASNKQETVRIGKPSNALLARQEQQEIPKMSPHTGSSRQMHSPNQGNLHISHQHHHHPGPNQTSGHIPSAAQHPGHLANSNNIPAHNVQTQVYQHQPQTMAVPPNFLPHGSVSGAAGGNQMYQVMPSVYYSNFTANVNVHGYTHAMQPSYLSPNAAPFIAQDQQNQIEQVRWVRIQK